MGHVKPLLPVSQLMKRADNAKDFVRRGSDSGWVEVTLSSSRPDRPIIIKRSMNAKSNSTEWMMNGAALSISSLFPYFMSSRCKSLETSLHGAALVHWL